MTSDLRVLHVLDHSLPLVSGYSIRTHYLLSGQRRMGMTPLAVTSPKHGLAERSEVIDGIEYLRLPALRDAGRSVPWLGECQLMVRLARRLARELSCRKIDLLHAHSPLLNGIPALWAARRAGIPMTYEVRALWEDAAIHRGTHRAGSLRYRTSRALEGWLMRRADALVVISLALVDEVVHRGVPRARVVHAPNGVDTTAFRPMEPDAALVRQHGLGGAVVFGFLGSFNRYEGLDVLVAAFAQLLATTPHARLVLVGDGVAFSVVRADARRLGVASQVVCVGPVAHTEARRWYSVCDVLVYPRCSNRDTELTTPLKPLEAMAMGKSVVASDVGGMRELIRSGETGLLCAPGDPTALACVLTDLARQPQRRAALGAAARRWVCETRDWKHLVPAATHAYQIALRRCGTLTARAADGTPEPAFKSTQ